jgi:hypothetical protein
MASLVAEIREAITAAEKISSSHERFEFAATVAAIEQLEIHVLDRLRFLHERVELSADLRGLEREATRLCGDFEAAQKRIIDGLRRDIKTRRLSPASLRQALLDQAGPSTLHHGYDALDLLVAGLLDAGAPARERLVREPEMVFYQPTPAGSILALIEDAGIGPGDRFFDLGSGLGQVVILVALLTGARARGIEIEPAYCVYARRSARGLGAAGVEIINADAREASLAGGTVYYLYTPFKGEMFAEVMRRLEAEASERPIRVCSFGPCGAELASIPWLLPAIPVRDDANAIAVFRGGPA